MNGNQDEPLDRREPESEPIPAPPPMPPPPMAPMPASAGYRDPGRQFRQMDFGRVFSSGFGAWFRNFVPFTALGLVLYAPAFILSCVLAEELWAVARGGQGIPRDEFMFVYLTTSALRLLEVFLSFLLTAAVVFGVFEQSLGRRPTIGRCLSMGFSRLFPVLGVSLVVGLAVCAGFILLCVPGLIFWCMWYVTVPIAVVERAGVGGSMTRSQFLTKGNRWLIFALVLVLGVIGGVVGGVIQFGAMWSLPATSGGKVLEAVIVQFVRMLANLLGAVMMSVTYYELRRVKEGTGVEELGAVFD